MSQLQNKSISYVTAAELVELLKGTKKDNILVVDVRESDYTFGKIKGSINMPFYLFEQQMNKLRDRIGGQEDGVVGSSRRKIIFHCYYSQTRGPTAAKMFLQYCQAHPVQNVDLDILVLEGGFKTFRTAYSEDCLVYEQL